VSLDIKIKEHFYLNTTFADIVSKTEVIQGCVCLAYNPKRTK